jgi:beta-lactamase regulating signal transducer with metallopeptidase domain
MFFFISEEWMRMGTMAAAALVSQLWQGTAVAVGLAVCLRLAPRTRASHRFALWMAAFVLVAALPLAPALAGLFVQPQPQPLHSAAQAAAPWFRLDERWGLAVAALWALLAAVRLGLLAAGALRAHKIWKDALPFPAASHLLSGHLPGRARVEICTSIQLDRPSVIGFLRPRILLPEWLAGKLCEAELRPILLHEFEHLRRMDDWTNLALKLVTALLPLNPALWWMERNLEREREMATDEAVVRRTRAPRAYAACLATVAERRLQMRLGQRELLELGIWRRRPELAERILSLLRTPETIGPVGRTALAASLAAALLGAVVLLAHAPQLVAFAPASQPAPSTILQPTLAAVKPAPVALSLKPKPSAQRPALHAAAPAASPVEPRATDPAEGFVPVVARMEQPAAAPAPDQSGWVVLAIFEQRVLVTHPAQLDADYGTGDAMAAEKKTAPSTLHSQTVWKLLPVVPMQDGWVVLEL